MREYITAEGDRLDAVCERMDGNTAAIEQVLSTNPVLASYDIGRLPSGLSISFDDAVIVKEQVIEPTVSLWD